MITKAKVLIDELQSLERELSNPEVYSDIQKATELGQKRKTLTPKVEIAKEFLRLIKQKDDAEEI